MQFKNPELLYALALLIIPIIVHLFQLRRFRKVEFTNVEFLKTVQKQTRKSRNLKKWLLLISRSLLLACLVFAFAQPFTSKSNSLNVESETVVYLDNSFSMQAKGAKGELMKRAVQELIEFTQGDQKISLFTNSNTFRNRNLKSLRNDLLQLEYVPDQLSYEAAILKGKELFSNDAGTIKNLIVISDFQQRHPLPLSVEDSTVQTRLVQLSGMNSSNISIDSAYISNRKNGNYELTVLTSNNTQLEVDVPVSLFNSGELIAKSSIEGSGTTITQFSVPAEELVIGELRVEDPSLQFDNSLFFNINEKQKIKVLSINQSNDEYLQRLFAEDEFEFSSFAYNQLNFNTINDQDLIILNELDEISTALQNALSAFLQNNNKLVIIPGENANLNSYSRFLSSISSISIQQKSMNEKRITEINFSHPLFEGVFDQTVSNFQFPVVQQSFSVSNTSASVLDYDDGSAFLVQSGDVFVFSAPLNSDNSNFTNSPLIVPIFYNFGKLSFKQPVLYYEIGKSNSFDIQVSLQQDDILKLKVDEIEIIPQQRSYQNKVNIITESVPDKAAVYEVVKGSEVISRASYNYSRKEALLNYHDLGTINTLNTLESVADALEEIKSELNINALWKWFAIFALIFLIIEMLILKFFK